MFSKKMFGFNQFFDMMGGMEQSFSVQLRCYSMPFFHRADVDKIHTMNYGGNILLPNSALDTLTRLNVQYPLLFKISGLCPEHQRVTHAGVLEFLAEEGKCYLPSWMMRQLLFEEGELAVIEYKSLPVASYAKFKPMSPDFLNISNPRAILEVELRKFRCLTKNDIITIAYNDQVLEFKVMDLKPQNAVSITECDVNLEFDTPEGYVESNNQVVNPDEMPEAPVQVESKKPGWSAFCGEGMRLDGKATRSRVLSTSSVNEQQTSTLLEESSSNLGNDVDLNVINRTLVRDVIVDENYVPGKLKFIRFNYKNRSKLLREQSEKQTALSNDLINNNLPFSGSAFTIRSQKLN